MKKTLIVSLAIFTIISQSLYADSRAEKAELTALLNDFLRGQSYAHHDRFWADDLIYTSSAGKRFDKQFIMDGMNPNAKPSKDSSEAETGMTYRAEEVDIRVYGTVAIVAFKLVGTEKKADQINQRYYFNTGTFLKRNEKWQAVAWQATKISGK